MEGKSNEITGKTVKDGNYIGTFLAIEKLSLLENKINKKLNNKQLTKRVQKKLNKQFLKLLKIIKEIEKLNL